jgi:hypothetical protein
MSEDLKHAHNPGVEFEPSDMHPRTVYSFLVGIAIGCVVVALVLSALYRVMDSYDRRHQPVQSPLAPPAAANSRAVPVDEASKFPQPRLEQNERVEINDFLLKEEDTLDSYGWVDQQAGVVRIPIDRAMELVAQRGLPTTPKAGTVPASEVGVVNQAAQKADVSNIKKKGKQ